MNWKQPKVYAVTHRSEAVRAASRSGGFFTAVSDWTLEKAGVVYGCVLDKNFHAVHIRAVNTANRNLMRGSKYIQSKLGETFKNVKSDLTNGRFVLFSGTSCQVAGLKSYLGKEYGNLLCLDIVCHGVPSPRVWEEYLQWQEKKMKSKVRNVDFRNKKDYGWRSHVETLQFENGKNVNCRIFTNMFYGHSVLRPSCYECPYKSVMHPGDITIADYWGVEKAASEFDDNKGVSLVLVNGETGERVFNSVKVKINWKETHIEDSLQPPLEAPFPEPENRFMFWDAFLGGNFKYVVKKYGGTGIVYRIKHKMRRIKRKMV